jgi:hypothetical protein
MMADAELSPEGIAASRERQLRDDYGRFVAGYVGLLRVLGPEGMSALLSDFFKLDIVRLSRQIGPRDPERAARLLAAYDAAPPGKKEAAVNAAANALAPKDVKAAMRLVEREIKRRASDAGPSDLEVTIALDDDDFAEIAAFASPISHAYLDNGNIVFVDAVEIWTPLTNALKALKGDKG